MRYLVLIASDPGVWERATAAERQAWFDAHDAFERAVAARGAKVSAAALARADSATTLRHPAGPSRGSSSTEAPSWRARSVACEISDTST